MKRILSVIAIVGLAMIFACGGGNDPKVVMNDFMDIMDGYVDAMAKAGSADDMVSAVEKSAAKMKALIPKMKAVSEKYPALKNLKPGAKLPEEFKEFEERMTQMGTKMMGAMGNAMKYMKDPKVMAAMKKFEEAMSDLK
jgi:hypothetical protein